MMSDSKALESYYSFADQIAIWQKLNNTKLNYM